MFGKVRSAPRSIYNLLADAHFLIFSSSRVIIIKANPAFELRTFALQILCLRIELGKA